MEGEAVQLQGKPTLDSLRILIVDDQPHARRSLKALLAAKFQRAEVREAEDGNDAVRCIEQLTPDVVLMDALMPNMDGLQATRWIKAAQPGIKVIVLSMYGEYRAAARSVGADAFVSKGDPPEVLLGIVAEMAGTGAVKTPGLR
jgi:DNA-binding NarL/FixJ family response regulator